MYYILTSHYMSTPKWAPVDPQANIKTQPVSLIFRQPNKIVTDGVGTLQTTMSEGVQNVVSRQDVEHLKTGDKIVSGSGTTREVIEKWGLHFVCNTTKIYAWDAATNNCFRASSEKMATNMSSAELFKLEPGTVVYWPENERMTIKSIIRGNNGQGEPYGVVVTFREEIDINLDTMGRWLTGIIKKDK